MAKGELNDGIEILFAVVAVIVIVLLGFLAWVVDNFILTILQQWNVQLSIQFAWVIAVLSAILIVIIVFATLANIING